MELGKSLINGPFSSQPCLITGGYATGKTIAHRAYNMATHFRSNNSFRWACTPTYFSCGTMQAFGAKNVPSREEGVLNSVGIVVLW